MGRDRKSAVFEKERGKQTRKERGAEVEMLRSGECAGQGSWKILSWSGAFRCSLSPEEGAKGKVWR